MGSAFSFENKDIKLRLIENLKDKELKDIDEILDAINQCRIEIAQRIDFLEQEEPVTIETEKEIAVLIRQEQYLQVLQNKPKAKLAEIFGRLENNCIVPEILQWYQGPKE